MIITNSVSQIPTPQYINHTRKLLFQFLDIKQDTSSFDMDIKILINNPVLSHTSRKVGCSSPIKYFSNNKRYKQVRGISLRSMQNIEYNFPLRSPEFKKHSDSQKNLLHNKREIKSRHKKTMTVPNFTQQSVENKKREEFCLLRNKKSKVKKAFGYLASQASFLKVLLKKKSSAIVCNSPKGDKKCNRKVFDEVKTNEYKGTELEGKRLKENDFKKHKNKTRSNRNGLTLAEKIEQLAFNLIVN